MMIKSNQLIRIISCQVNVLGALCLFFLSPQAFGLTKDTMVVAGFGSVRLYKPQLSPSRVIICISGDGGWNAGIEHIALKLKDAETLLIGVDIRPVFRYMNRTGGNCAYPAADFERMSQFVQKKLGYKTYMIPVLLGYSSGATLVYGLLAQAPQNTFMGGLVLGFCPDINMKKPLCAGSGKFSITRRKDGKGYNLGPVSNLSAPFFSLQGQTDQVCNYTAVVSFLRNVPGATVVSLPNVGHGYGTEKNWLPQLMESYKRIMDAQISEIRQGKAIKLDLPLHITPAMKGKQGAYMAVFISGDGGWTGFDQQTVNALAQRGIPIVGIDALKYFWEQKSPEQLSRDLARIIEVYRRQWKKEKIILIGYSFGADVMPFAYNRLPAAIKNKVSAVGLLSPSKETDFEIHISDLLHIGSSARGYSVPDEINKMTVLKAICFFGKEEDGLPVGQIQPSRAKIVYLKGGHHYIDASGTITAELLLQP